MSLTPVHLSTTVIWHPSMKKSACMGTLETRRLWNLSAVQDQGESFLEIKLTPRWLTHWPWSQLQTGNSSIPWELSYSPIGSGSVTGTICQGTWEESGPSVNQVIGIQTSAPALHSEVAHEPAPAHLSTDWKPLEVGPLNLVRSNCRFWNDPVTGLQHIPAAVHWQSCWYRDPAAGTPICTFRKPERTP